MVSVDIRTETCLHKFVTGDAGLQFDVDGLALHIFVDGPNGETVDFEIPIDEARRDLLLMLALADRH